MGSSGHGGDKEEQKVSAVVHKHVKDASERAPQGGEGDFSGKSRIGRWRQETTTIDGHERRGRSTVPRGPNESTNANHTTTTTTVINNNDRSTTIDNDDDGRRRGLCDQMSCVAGKPDPFSKVMAQDFVPVLNPPNSVPPAVTGGGHTVLIPTKSTAVVPLAQR